MTDVKDEVEGQIVDERNGEIIPRGIDNEVAFQQPTNTLVSHVNINTIGTIDLSPESEVVLSEPLDEKDVLIRPDGMVYLPWTWYAERLNRAFGKLKWGMVPQGKPQSKDTGNNNVLVVWGFWMVIKGVPIGFSYGETSYRTDNPKMSYGDAVEGAKSIALARNCKMLGMSLELWNQEWVSAWKKKYAEKYEDDKGRTLWRKKIARKSESPMTDEAKDLGGVEVETKKDDQQEEKKYSVSALRSMEVVKTLASMTGAEKSKIATFLGTLTKGEYTLAEVARKFKENNNA